MGRDREGVGKGVGREKKGGKRTQFFFLFKGKV